MRRRCPRGEPLGAARLGGHALRIALPLDHPPGQGFATVVPAPGAFVPGALFRLGPGDLAALDAYEDCPALYLREELPVEDLSAPGGSREVRAALYRMRGPLRPARPRPDYVQTLREGYTDFGLPLEALEAALGEAGIP
ncbi:MAG: gamma-glutamylcyclotransferase [Candidatus Tectomicrobia bacterium]|uniref:Gamma-glutamylcyclotransferase n=1 Tax=Tectimicrobiota bacterium TaxID=2528274 RepID=A0A932HZZ4_UNCTE|nr:gamma-glutamylcyclotransferase [Candidatus Tectomicrobia bacterium]